MQPGPVVADVGDFVRHDQVMLRVDGGLHVVAHQARAFGLRDHRARVGVGSGELTLGQLLQLHFGLIELTHLRAQLPDLVLQSLGLRLDLGRLRAVGRLQGIEVALDAVLDLLLTLVDLAGGEVAVPAVDRLELAAVDGNDGLREEPEFTAQDDEAPADAADARAVAVAEVGNGLEVGRQTSGEPHQFHIALRLALQPAAGLDAVQIAVDIELEQNGGVVCGPPRQSRIGAFEPQRKKVEFFDEGIDDAHRIVFTDEVVEALGQQGDLLAGLAFDKSLHGPPR